MKITKFIKWKDYNIDNWNNLFQDIENKHKDKNNISCNSNINEYGIKIEWIYD